MNQVGSAAFQSVTLKQSWFVNALGTWIYMGSQHEMGMKAFPLPTNVKSSHKVILFIGHHCCVPMWDSRENSEGHPVHNLWLYKYVACYRIYEVVNTMLVSIEFTVFTTCDIDKEFPASREVAICSRIVERYRTQFWQFCKWTIIIPKYKTNLGDFYKNILVFQRKLYLA